MNGAGITEQVLPFTGDKSNNRFPATRVRLSPLLDFGTGFRLYARRLVKVRIGSKATELGSISRCCRRANE